MPLPAPNLDDRTFQNLVDDCKRMIPRYCPEWTDHNVSDPGIALIELFSWLVEQMLYRLNQVPDKNYIKYMDLLGVRLRPPSAAQAEITFWLSAAQPTPITVPLQTEVATLRTEATEALVFTTEHDLTIIPPTLIAFQGWPVGHPPRQHLQDLRFPRLEGQGVHVFSDHPIAADRPAGYHVESDQPQPDDALYIGFAEDLSRNILNLGLVCREAQNVGINPSNPPFIWEAWLGEQQGWTTLELAREDTTGGLTGAGDIALYLPADLAEGYFGGQDARSWIRGRIIPSRPNQGIFSESPEIIRLVTTTIGGTAVASHSQVVMEEELGVSDATPGQSFNLRAAPVLPRRLGEAVQVENDHGDFEPWTEVESFWPVGTVCPTCGRPHASHNGTAADVNSAVSPTSPTQRWYQIDDMTGLVQFAPLVREPDGSARQCGAIPAKGRRVRIGRYRHGGGAGGNVGPNTIVVLKQAIPYINPAVNNRRPATGGADAESLDRAKLRAPMAIRTRDRAVTAADFEQLARAASSSVARVKCLQAGPIRLSDAPTAGQVTVLLVPEVPDASGPVLAEQLRLDANVRSTVLRYLDERRLLTTTLIVDDAPAVGVAIQAQAQILPTADPDRVRAAVERRLYRFLHPTQGWTDGKGWPFGRDLTIYDLYGLIQGVSGVIFVSSVNILPLQDGAASTPVDRLTIPPGAVVYSGRHTVTVARAEGVTALAWDTEEN
ncbi:MAG: putative baseplate assembly protein [Chloroflexi bacterium]|nr:putative baseplate assembly protein [Chloroflexota bacterium]